MPPTLNFLVSLTCCLYWCCQAVESSKHASGPHAVSPRTQPAPQAEAGTSTSGAQLSASASPRAAEPILKVTEPNQAQDTSSSGNAVLDMPSYSNPGANSVSSSVAVAGSMATTAKRGLEQQGAPDAKRQKALSKESLAAMAAIAATARLPSQVMQLVLYLFTTS